MPCTRADVITVSDRCAAGAATDVSGPAAAEALEALGYQVRIAVVPDGIDSVAQAIEQAVDQGACVVVTTGGTGVNPRDLTAEGTAHVLERQLPGIPEAIRAAGSEATPTAVLSRGIAGTVGETFIVNLPGSPGGVRDGMKIVGPLIGHILEQLQGGDHA